ncbi:MAG TPA: hypothetical protein DCG75_03100 [Bacteroidales bacterium]|nr:hypothetical protein [Bacteroidales bacterium]
MAETKYICTYFDYNFLPRGLALYDSIKKFHKEFIYYVLAFDDSTYNYLLNLKYKNLVPIAPKSYDNYFKTSIDRFEDKKQYFFSATPNICLYIFNEFPQVDSLLYLDSDVYVFNSLEPLYEEIGDASIAICSHRFHLLFNILSKNYGRYNVGVNYFKNDKEGNECLKDWKKDCDSWYPNKPGYPLNFFSDQIFLDNWIHRYKDIKEITNIGVDVAPWNMMNYKFKLVNEIYYVNNTPLIIYHFSSLKKIGENSWNGNTIFFFGSIQGNVKKLYKEYISKIESFGLSNTKISSLSHKNSIIKKIFYFFMNLFMNETLKMD